MCKCVCVHLSVCVSMNVQMHMYASRGHPGLLLSSAHLAFLRWFFFGLGFSQLCRLVNEPQDPCLCPPVLRLQAYTTTSSFFRYGFWGPNSGPHAEHFTNQGTTPESPFLINL